MSNLKESNVAASKSKKRWIDHTGIEIPAKFVPITDKKKDELAYKLIKRAHDLEARLQCFHTEFFESMDDLYQYLMDESKVKLATKGNFTITSFDKSIKLEVTVQETIAFDEHVDFAKEKIFGYLKEQLGDKEPELRQLIYSAFEKSRGGLDTKRVLGLMKLKISHPLWLEGIELIKKSISRNNSKRYGRVWVRQADGSYKVVNLNFSNL